MLMTFIPLLVVAVIAVIHYLLTMIGVFSIQYLSVLFWAISCFAFGLSLHGKSRQNRTWVLKLVITLIIFLLLAYQFGWISIPLLSHLSTNLYIYLIYIFCGWAFFKN